MKRVDPWGGGGVAYVYVYTYIYIYMLNVFFLPESREPPGNLIVCFGGPCTATLMPSL